MVAPFLILFDWTSHDLAPVFNDIQWLAPRQENLTRSNKTLDVYLGEKLSNEDQMNHFQVYQINEFSFILYCEDDEKAFYDWIDTEFPPEPTVSGS